MRKVVIAGPVQTQSGYGHHTREIVENIIEQKGSEWDVKLLSLPWGGTPMTFPLSDDLKSRIIPLPLREQPDVWVQVSVPNELQAIGKYNIGVTAGSEGDICPETWIDNLNAMQLVIVPSEFTKHVFESSAIKYQKTINTPIYVIPEYFDENVYNNKTITASLPELDSIPETFAFLSVGHWLSGEIGEDRKNVGALIHRFFDTFKNKKNQPALILKTSGATYSVMDRMDIENKINQIRSHFEPNKLPNVYLVHGDLTDDEMNALYNHTKVKALVTFTKAEGFGRPLLEFATTGKPIMAPCYSGQADFLKSEFICALPGGLTPIHPSAQNDWLIKDARWFTVDYRYAGKMMLEIQENYKKWIEPAKRQRYFVNNTFTRKAVAPFYEKVLAIASENINNIPIAMQIQLPTLPKMELPSLKKI